MKLIRAPRTGQTVPRNTRTVTSNIAMYMRRKPSYKRYIREIVPQYLYKSIQVDATSYVKKNAQNKYQTLVIEVDKKDDIKLAKDLTINYDNNYEAKYVYDQEKSFVKDLNLVPIKLNIVNAKDLDSETRNLLHRKLNLDYIRSRIAVSTGKPIYWAGTDKKQAKQLIEGGRYSANGYSFYFTEWKTFGKSKRHFCGNCLLHTTDQNHKTNNCPNVAICPNCAREHQEEDGTCEDSDPVCRNCSEGMDDHRADSIDCPEMRTTKGMTDETYEAHLRQLAIKQTNGASTEDMDALWEATEKNKSSIDKDFAYKQRAMQKFCKKKFLFKIQLKFF